MMRMTRSMGRLAAAGCVVAAALVGSIATAGVEKEAATPSPISQVGAESLWGFSARWFDPQAEGNQLYSPVSMREAFGMAALAARGRTQDGFARLLLDQARFGSGAAWQKSTLEEWPPELRVANAVMLAEDMGVRPAYSDGIEDGFGAELLKMDFAASDALETVNTWFAKKTAGHIPDMLSELPKDSRFVIANALHFKAAWQSPFNKNRTEEADFRAGDGSTQRVPMMRQTLNAPLFETESWQALKLAFDGGSFDLLVALPPKDGGTSLPSEALLQSWLQPTDEARALRRVAVQLPRFRISTGGSVRERTKQLGLVQAYSDCADFSDMADEPLKLGDIIHRAMLSVDEDGAEAAAATAVVGVRSAAMPIEEAVPFVVDRAFLVWLVHRPSMTPVIVGSVQSL